MNLQSNGSRRRRWKPRDDRAFTRLELCAVGLALGLVAFVVLPALGASRTRADRIACANNLRQVGVAFLVWANDREDRVPFEVPVAEGGTLLHSLAPNAWLHFSWISNELRSPKILLCPSDVGTPARDFTGNPAGGYVHPNFANRATSYFLTHRLYGGPMALLGGDRNFTGFSQVGCSFFGSAVEAVWPSFSWKSGLHEGEGNVVLVDGQVVQTDTVGLRATVGRAIPDSGDLHFVAPR